MSFLRRVVRKLVHVCGVIFVGLVMVVFAFWGALASFGGE